MNRKFRLGLIINPVAGLGGRVALKGSDGVTAKALALGAKAQAVERAREALLPLRQYQSRLEIITADGVMGGSLAKSLGFFSHCVDRGQGRSTSTLLDQTTAQDTIDLATTLANEQVDLLLFVGGDGTARNIFTAVGERVPVLGVPAGVKIHSGVYAVTPSAAGKVVTMLLTGELVTLMEADVMDIDEDAFRQGVVRARRYGEMQVPAQLRYIQAVKMGGKESDELVLADIAADVIGHMDDELYVMGSGSTLAFIMEELGLDNTLLGVDLIRQQSLVASDQREQQLLTAIEQARKEGREVKLVITLIGGQGHLFGRGNQQLSPAVLRAIGKEQIIVVATKNKLKALNGRPLLVDTGDSKLNKELSGYCKITTGYNDYVMYAVGNPEDIDS